MSPKKDVLDQVVDREIVVAVSRLVGSKLVYQNIPLTVASRCRRQEPAVPFVAHKEDLPSASCQDRHCTHC